MNSERKRGGLRRRMGGECAVRMQAVMTTGFPFAPLWEISILPSDRSFPLGGVLGGREEDWTWLPQPSRALCRVCVPPLPPVPHLPPTASPSQGQLQSSHCFQKGPELRLAALVTQGELQQDFQGPSGQLAQCRPSWSVTELSAWGVWPPHLGPEPRPRHCTSKA